MSADVRESLYVGFGRKCSCGCFFVSEADWNSHKAVCAELRDERLGWHKGPYGGGEEICSAINDPELVAAIKRNGGKVSLGRFEV